PMLRLVGTPASPGLASGPIFLLETAPRGRRSTGSVEAEHKAIGAALAVAQLALGKLSADAVDDNAAAILAFQLALLEDDEITRPTRVAIDTGQPADEAWRRVMDTLIEDYVAAEDAYFQGRATDLRDLRDRVLDALSGAAQQMIPDGAIVLAEDLAPSRFL